MAEVNTPTMAATNTSGRPTIRGELKTPDFLSIEGSQRLPTYSSRPTKETTQFVVYDYFIDIEPPVKQKTTDTAEEKNICTYEERYVWKEEQTLKNIVEALDPDVNQDAINKVKIVELWSGQDKFQELCDEINRHRVLLPHGEEAVKHLSLNFKELVKLEPPVALRCFSSKGCLRLFVSIPHLCIGKRLNAGPGLLTIDQFQQTQFVVFDSDLIVMSRTAGEDHSSPLPFFPNQHRIGAAHLLLHMICTAIEFGTREVFLELRKNLRKLEQEIRSIMDNPVDEEDSEEQKNRKEKEKQDTKSKLSSLLNDIDAVSDVVQEQIELLEKLSAVLWNAYRDPHNPGYNDSICPVPIKFHGRGGRKIISDGFEMAIVDRKGHLRKFKELLQEGRNWQKSMFLSSIEHGSRGTMKHSAANAAQFKMASETMSMFTVVTTLFLPLSFFTSLFALVPFSSNLSSEKFWSISLPITLAFVIGTLYIVLIKKYESGEYQRDRPIVRILCKLRILKERKRPNDVEANGQFHDRHSTRRSSGGGRFSGISWGTLLGTPYENKGTSIEFQPMGVPEVVPGPGTNHETTSEPA